MLSIIAAAMASAAAPEEPTGKWVVDFADAQCVASREYGADQLYFKAPPIGDVVQFGLIRPGGVGEPEQVNISMFWNGSGERKASMLRWVAGEGGGKRTFHLVNMPASDFAAVASSSSVRLVNSSMSREFRLSGLAQLATVLKECADDLSRTWSPGDGPAVKRASANLASFFTDEDYPDQAIEEGVHGTSAFALLVDAEGRVADCSVIGTSGAPILDVQACAILRRRARFAVATDAGGKPAKDRLTGRIRWQISKDDLRRPTRSR